MRTLFHRLEPHRPAKPSNIDVRYACFSKSKDLSRVGCGVEVIEKSNLLRLVITTMKF